LPGLGIVSGTSSPVRYVRKRHLIDTDDVALSIAVSGETRFAMCGREYTMRSGDATLTGAGEGGINECTDCRYLVLRVPAKAITPDRPVGDLIGRRIPAKTPALQLLRGYLGILDEPAAFATAQMQHTLATHVHDLVGLTLGATRDATEVAKQRGAGAARLRAIKADIADNLACEGLSVTAVAARHRLQVRYVQRLFESEGTSFTQFVLEQRLARARQILVDPRLAHLKVSTVASEAGFANMSHFSATFRRRYGVAPSDLREQARQAV
jgi:AraC-like DNA-binding protein